MFVMKLYSDDAGPLLEHHVSPKHGFIQFRRYSTVRYVVNFCSQFVSPYVVAYPTESDLEFISDVQSMNLS